MDTSRIYALIIFSVVGGVILGDIVFAIIVPGIVSATRNISNSGKVTANNLHASIASSATIMNIGQSVTIAATVTGGESPYFYAWQKNGTRVGTSTTYRETCHAAGRWAYQLAVKDSSSPCQTATSNQIVITVSSQPSGNLLQNPGFSIGSESSPYHWNHYGPASWSWGDNSYVKLQSNSLSGSSSWVQSVDLTPLGISKPTNFTASVRVKTRITERTGPDGGACILINCYTGSSDSTWQYGDDSMRYTFTKNWTGLSSKYTLETSTKRIEFCCNIKNAIGTVYFDDASFTLDPPEDLSSLTPLGRNILYNPNCNVGLYAPDFWWTYQDPGGADWIWDSNQCLKIRSSTFNNASWLQTIYPHLTRSVNFVIHASVKANITRIGHGGVVLVGIQYKVPNGGWYYSNSRVILSPNWSLIEHTGTLPANTVEARFVCKIANAIGEVWFDDTFLILQ